MADVTVISFVRHGMVHNPRSIYYGRLPRVRLSEEGRAQAQAAAAVLRDKPVAAAFSSPLLRARQTAAIILVPHDGLTLRISPLLTEVHTYFEGHPRSEVAARNWDIYTGIVPPYEQPGDVLARAQQFIAGARRQYAGRHVVAITHGDVLAFTMLWVKGAPLIPMGKQTLRSLGLPDNYPAPASIATLTYRTAEPNEVPHLDYLKPYGCAA